jgi:hypothetical protein
VRAANITAAIANSLQTRAKSEINKRNSTKDVDELLDDWEKRTGIHPFTFQDDYLEGLRFLRDASKRENRSLLIRAIVRYRRPDLMLPSTAPPSERSPALTALASIERSLRELLDRPPELLRLYFELRHGAQGQG